MKSTILFSIFLVFSFFGSGQAIIDQCTFEVDPTSYKEKINALELEKSEVCNLGMTSIPIAITFLNATDSTSGYYAGLEDEILDSISAHFIPKGVHLYLAEQPTFIYEDLVYDFVIGEHVEYIYPGIQSNRINIVLTNSVSYSNGANVCGIAKAFPNTVFIRYSCIPANTVSHEIGHELGLAHTHHTQFGVELVNGSNCNTAGDLICDTPADPNRIDLCSSECVWEGTYEDENGYDIYLVDPNGDPYAPDVHNLMSYYGALGCRNHFSYLQARLMLQTIQQKLLSYGYETAKMKFEIYDREDLCDLGYAVSAKVSNASPDVIYQWDMNSDGIIDHTGLDANFIYTDYGHYTIQLVMTYPDGRTFFQSKVCEVAYSNDFINAPFLDDYNELIERKYVSLIEQSAYKWNLKLHMVGGRIVANDQIHINEKSIMEYNVNIGDLIQPVLTFEYRCNTEAIVGGDSLLIEILSCTDEPIVLFEKWGKSLGTNDQFISVNLPFPNVNSDIIRLRFTTKGDASDWHDIQIDDLQVYEGDVTSVKHNEGKKFNIFPNPTNSLIQIQSPLDILKVDLFNLNGKVLTTYLPHEKIDLSNFPQGIYFFCIYTQDKQYVQKVLKQ